MGNEIVNKHDAMFKEVFSHKEIAKSFLENNIPKEALDTIDIDNMELSRDSFENEELKETFSDLIYSTKINGRDAYICFLYEHKSYRDKLTAFQLNKYILEIWIETIQKQEKEELPIILPLVIYHGTRDWNIRTDLRDMIPDFYSLPSYFQERIPVFKYDLYNIGESGEDNFGKYTKLAAMMLTAFKFSHEEDIEIVLEEFLLVTHDAMKEKDTDELTYFIRIYLNYIQQTHRDISEDELIEKIKKIEGKEAIKVSILDKIEKEGIEKGIAQGRQEGRQEERRIIARTLLKEGAEIALVVKATGLSKKEIEKLKKEV